MVTKKHKAGTHEEKDQNSPFPPPPPKKKKEKKFIICFNTKTCHNSGDANQHFPTVQADLWVCE